MKSFYTMYDDIENIHLIKDLGMIPYTLSKMHYYKAYIVSYGKKNNEFPYLEKEVRGLNLVVRPKLTGNTIVDGCIWLLGNAKKIDLLNLYHFGLSTFLWIVFYKLVNRKGKIYLKLDISAESGINMSMRRGTLKYWLTKNILGKCNLISAETKEFQKHADKFWPVKVEYISNGVSKVHYDSKFHKEKIILTVGRLGTRQKATEILMAAFENALPHISQEWKLLLVGSMTKEFEDYYDRKLDRNPRLRERIVWLGELNDRARLKEIYKKATIFTMPSRWEGFCLVGIEALSNFDFLITSNLLSFSELIDKRFGKTFPVDDIEEYSNTIISTCNEFDAGNINLNRNEIIDYINENYCYENICEKIYRFMEDS